MWGHIGWVCLGGSILLVGLITIAPTSALQEVPEILDDGILEELAVDYEHPDEQLTIETFHSSPTPCCAQPNLSNSHYLIASTMDGKIQALDVLRNGDVAWEANFDDQPLLQGTLGTVQPMEADGKYFHLVPALDGSLYMYSTSENILEPIPLSTEALLQASVKIGHEAVAGGRTVTTTGVDPLTGKIRYHCTSAACEASSDSDVEATLVFRRHSHSVRAMDALNGSERWNLSVAEYDASLLKKRNTPISTASFSNVRYLLRPPEGIITALDSCGNTMWSRQIGNHLIHIWEMAGGELREISLFDSNNIHTLSSDDENSLISSESLFYLGTSAKQPFIVHSPHLKFDNKRVARTVDWGDGRTERQIMGPSKSTYFVESPSMVDMLTFSYRNSLTATLSNSRARNEKRLAVSGSNELQVVKKKDRRSFSGSCNSNEDFAMIGERDIISASIEPFDNDLDASDQGFFVLNSRYTPRRSMFGIRDTLQQCGMRMRRTFRVEEAVSGWWRAIALVGVAFLGMLIPILVHWRRAIPLVEPSTIREVSEDSTEERVKAVKDAEVQHDENRNESKVDHEDYQEAKQCPENASACDLQENENKKTSSTTSMEYPSTKSTMLTDSEPPSPAGTRSQKSASSNSEGFTSKFLQDFEPERVLGKGGYGVVFEALNKLDQTKYAIKRIAVDNGQRAIERVRREIRAMAQLEHPGIIRYYHSWIEEPPSGWQEEIDAGMLQEMKARRKISELGDYDSHSFAIDQPAPIGRSGSEASDESGKMRKGQNIPSTDSLEENYANDIVQFTDGVETFDEDDDSGSWQEDSHDRGTTVDSSDEDSDDDASNSYHKVQHVPLRDHEEESDDIVFGSTSRDKRSRQASYKSQASSQEVSAIETSLVLVTSNNDLLPSRDTKSHVYVYIQMQLCQRKTLSDWLKNHCYIEHRSPKKMRGWFAQLVDATAYIHDQGLIHRDIKPQNIFFTINNQLKIGDMGLVSKNVILDAISVNSGDDSSSSLITHTGDVGTRTYMSPEQLAHKDYTFKVDVFSLGMIFCEMIVPFSTTMERIHTLSDLQRGRVPEVLDTFVDEKKFISWLCNFDPDSRPTCPEILQSGYLESDSYENLVRQRSLSRRFSLSDLS